MAERVKLADQLVGQRSNWSARIHGPIQPGFAWLRGSQDLVEGKVDDSTVVGICLHKWHAHNVGIQRQSRRRQDQHSFAQSLRIADLVIDVRVRIPSPENSYDEVSARADVSHLVENRGSNRRQLGEHQRFYAPLPQQRLERTKIDANRRGYKTGLPSSRPISGPSSSN